MRGAAPWCLDADQLSDWLETHWVSSDDTSSSAQRKRRKLANALADTNGFELLTACTTDDSKVPFVQITRTKTGNTIDGAELTAFLHATTGLAFYYQMWCAATSELSPLLDYDFVQLLRESESAFGALIREHESGDTHTIKVVRNTGGRSAATEIRLHNKVSSSKFVATIHHSSRLSEGMYFGIGELVPGLLKDRIGSVDEGEFWR